MKCKLLSSIFFVTLFSCFLTSSALALSTRTCNPKVPKTVKYRPKYGVCKGNAAILLSGIYKNAFSVVFKKVDHNDRLANNEPGAANSPFKTQFKETINGTVVNCFGAAGDSPVFKGVDPDFGYKPEYVVKWISIKRKNSGQIKDVDIYCLPKPYPVTKLN